MAALSTPEPPVPKDDIDALSKLLLNSDSDEPTTIPDSCDEDVYDNLMPGLPKEKHIKCETCDIAFKSKCTLSAHKKRQHLKKFKFSCSQCTQQFFCQEELKEHKAKIHNVTGVCKCNSCGQIFATFRGMRLHVKSHLGLSFKCEHCDKACKTESNLKRHVLTHNKTFDCHECKKYFSHKAELKQHSIKHQESPVMYGCKDCPFQSKWRNAVRRHVDQVHGNIRRYVCDLCGSAFRDNFNLQRHLKGMKCLKENLKDSWEEI